MSSRDMNNKIYHESEYKADNEPEEGEIVDDYDLIVSSDEELCMRQRIRELEAENEEIEQIAVISRSYVDKISPLENSRAAQVPTDASSISSTEFVTPKKRKRRKSREHKRKHCHHQHQHQHHHQYEEHYRYDQEKISLKTRSRKTHCKRRQKLFAKKQQKVHSDLYIHKDISAETVPLQSPESSDSSSSLPDNDSYSKNLFPFNRKEDSFDYGKYISRDTLRLAVARNSNESIFATNKSCLKDKLMKQDLVGQSGNNIQDDRLAVVGVPEVLDDNAEDDDDVQVIENEPDIQTVDEDSTDSMEEKELRLIALKSAVLKKHMARKMRNAEAAYSPTDFEEMLSSDILRQENKLDDIDVVDLDADDFQNACVTVSPVASPQLMVLDDQDESQQMVDCKPIDMDIANSDSEGTTISSWPKEVEPALPTFSSVSHEFANHFQYGYYMQELNEQPPPPPGVDDYEDAPPPPPYHKIYTAEDLQDMELDNEELTENQHWLENNDICTRESNQSEPDKASLLPSTLCYKEDIEDEEEEALRALLLSKFQSPKNQKKLKRPNEATECQDTSNINVLAKQSYSKPKKPTEFILKEAVKRLKIHSQSDLCREEFADGFNNQSKFGLSIKPLECSANKSDSLTLLNKLRNRLNKYKNPSQTIKTDCPYQEDIDESDDSEKIKDGAKQMDIAAEKANSDMCIVENEEEQAVEYSNALKITNKIDISDITRRLQQIKENVLNSTKKNSPKVPLTNVCPGSQVKDEFLPSKKIFKVNDNFEEEAEERSQTLSEKISHLYEPFNNNLDNLLSTNSEFNNNNAFTKDKTVEANFDVTTNQTTFKITITNSTAIKSEDKDIKTAITDGLFKENRADNVSKNIKLKDNVNSISKAAANSEKLENNKTTASSAEIKPQTVTATTPVKTIGNKDQVAAVLSYSLLRATKIVKPNKVINANFDLNRRQNSQAIESTSATKATSVEASSQVPSGTDNSRLITSIEHVKHMFKVAPFVINVQNSSNESSGDEWAGEYDSLSKTLYDYNDNASPLSLNLESPSRTPLRSNSPTDPGLDGSIKNTDLNAKLDAFLKKARTSVQPATHQSSESGQGEHLNKTPLAVRHLPAAAQSEYRRLLHRMKLLENKRKSSNVDESTTEENTSKKNDVTLTVKEDLSKEKDNNKADSTSSTPKTSLVKKVLIRNATTTNESQIANGTAPSPKFRKTNILRSYENLYVKFGAGIVNNLDKSLKLVEEAKIAKITKLKLETRLIELKAEMDILQSEHKEQQHKISRIYPSICTTNEVITSLKQKRSKVFKAALNLGKTLKGEDYRLNNDLKESITTKSKQLATEIKIVNSLKAQDINNKESVLKTDVTTKELTEDKKKTVEDCKKKSNSENIEIKLTDNNAAVCSARDKENEEENRVETPLKSDVGGNTEFQNMESHISTSPVKSKDTCRSDVNARSSNTDAKTDAKRTSTLPSYISPLEHLRNIDSNMDPNGVVCPYDLMGNCEDVTCKYVHITPKAKT